ncbi:putative mediator of RNA polymerase II transcription subunit 26 [Drosophila guanche]|uniref:Uncharacterized protein n=1 Tax=Drosophila guanche TaxID=7266 RepID=A0A3B0KUS6_DROGU|nr:putative mediator of RNA polymerase II transcription subunit 26 [Drosophila guanche]SPP89081.1 Hypothetical predicted protein [Drosophila guanche]
MKLRVFLLLSAALAATTVQAVVQPGRNQQLFNHNRDGYRYNGPAHKYLPAEGPPSTEAGIITGPWQSHGSHGNHIPQFLEQQQGYNGPYNTQPYGQGQGQGQEPHRQEEHSWQQVQHQQQRPEPWQSAQGLGQQGQQYHQQHQSQSYHQQHHQDVEYSTEHQGRPAEHHQQGFLLQQESHQQRPESWQAAHGQGFAQEQHQQQEQEHEQQQQQPLGTHWQPSQVGHNSERFPLALAHASSHKTVAAPARDIKLVPAYTLSSFSDQDRFIGLDALDTRLLSQSLPDAYQRVPFNAGQPPSRQQGLGQVQGQRHEELLGGSPQQQQHQQSQDYVQMQSHSYQLPSSHTMQREWPQQQQQHNSGDRHYSESAFALSSNPSPHSSSHSLNPSYSQQNYLSHPSREFQPPYYR